MGEDKQFTFFNIIVKGKNMKLYLLRKIWIQCVWKCAKSTLHKKLFKFPESFKSSLEELSITKKALWDCDKLKQKKLKFSKEQTKKEIHNKILKNSPETWKG